MVSRRIDSISPHVIVSYQVQLKIGTERMPGECNGCYRYPLRPGFMLHVPTSMVNRGNVLSARGQDKFLVKSIKSPEFRLTCDELAEEYPCLDLL